MINFNSLLPRQLISAGLDWSSSGLSTVSFVGGRFPAMFSHYP